MTDFCGDEVCVTCSDRLSAVRLEWVSEDGSRGRGIEDGTLHEISTELLDGVHAGDVVLVHGGVALQRGDAPEAGR